MVSSPAWKDVEGNGTVRNGGGGSVSPLLDAATLAGRLEAADVRNVGFVLKVFEKFDKSRDRLVSITELRVGLRILGRYYSTRQTCDIVESFRRSTNRNGDDGARGGGGGGGGASSSLLQQPLLSKGDFIRLLLRHGAGEFKPLDDFRAEAVTKGPSVVVDVVARWCYPLLYFGKCVYFYYALSQY